MFAQLRPAPPPPGASFRALHLRSAGFRPLWHLHDVFELNHVVVGQGTRWVGGAQGRFGPGEVVLVPPDLPHSWTSDDEGPAEAVVVLFPLGIFGGEHGPPEWEGTRRLLSNGTGGVIFHDLDDALGALLRGLEGLEGAARLVRFLEVAERLGRVPSLALAGGPRPDHPGASDLAIVRRALALLARSEGAVPAQAEVAARLGLSPTGFSRLFLRATGRTWSSHVAALRIETACALLQGTDLRVSEVSYRAGFANLSNFNRRFREAKGQSPRQYRRAFAADAAGLMWPSLRATAAAEGSPACPPVGAASF